MRFRTSETALALALLAAAAAGAAEPAFVRVSPRDPRYFELTDGRPFIPIGLNMVHPGGNPTNGLAVMDDWLSRLSANGGNFIRIWLSSAFWNPETAPGRFDEARGRRLADLLDIAGRHGVRVKITLDHFREVDPANPGKTWALKADYHVSRGGPAASMKDFFDGAAGRAVFLKRLDWLAERFRDRPEVFGWELWNEINAAGGGAEAHERWTRDMLAELRRRFPRHLVMQSLGSFDRAGSTELYRRYATMAGNDVAQVHRYLDLGAQLEICHGPMGHLAADAVTTLLGFNLGKPVLLAEGGAVEPSHSGPFKLYAKDRDGILLHDVLFAPFFAGAAGSGQCWHWDQYVAKNDLWRVFRGFAKSVAGLDPAAEDFRPVILDASPAGVLALAGRTTLLGWCVDPRSDWHSELEQGMAPPTTEHVIVNLSDLLRGRSVVKAAAYDPWRDTTTPIEVRLGWTSLPPFKRSAVVRIEWRPCDEMPLRKQMEETAERGWAIWATFATDFERAPKADGLPAWSPVTNPRKWEFQNTRDLFANVVTEDIVQVKWGFFAEPGVPMAEGSVTNFTSTNNSWRMASVGPGGFSMDAPVLWTKNLVITNTAQPLTRDEEGLPAQLRDIAPFGRKGFVFITRDCRKHILAGDDLRFDAFTNAFNFFNKDELWPEILTNRVLDP